MAGCRDGIYVITIVVPSEISPYKHLF